MILQRDGGPMIDRNARLLLADAILCAEENYDILIRNAERQGGKSVVTGINPFCDLDKCFSTIGEFAKRVPDTISGRGPLDSIVKEGIEKYSSTTMGGNGEVSIDTNQIDDMPLKEARAIYVQRRTWFLDRKKGKENEP